MLEGSPSAPFPFSMPCFEMRLSVPSRVWGCEWMYQSVHLGGSEESSITEWQRWNSPQKLPEQLLVEVFTHFLFGVFKTLPQLVPYIACQWSSGSL